MIEAHVQGRGQPRPSIEVDAGVVLPSAFTGLRRVLECVREISPGAVQRAVARHPAGWNRLFPGSVQDAPDLSDLALSPSERRLHRESEQTFCVLNLAAGTIVDALRDSGRTLVVKSAGESDLVSLRGLMRAMEWARLHGVERQLKVQGWDAIPAHQVPIFARRRSELLDVLRARMRIDRDPSPASALAGRPMDPVVDHEGTYLSHVLDEARGPEERVAAAVLAIRAAFFSTNYEGAMLAAHHALQLLDRHGAQFSEERLVAAWEARDVANFITPAIEIDRQSLGGPEEMRALLHRQVGVICVYTGQHEPALDAFAAGLERKISPERLGQLRMYRALTLIKRLGNLERARAEVEAGLSAMAGRTGRDTALHEGWLRNVYALTYFQEKALEQAMYQEKLAMKCVGDLHDPSATHLKINLISNVSVLQETAKKFDDAIATWRRFEKISEKWGDNFQKHHRYRLAGLQLRGGQVAEAQEGYQQAYQSAAQLGDTFHRQVMAGELGMFHLQGGRGEEARRWFQLSAEAAEELGDPLRVAETQAGLHVCGGGDLARAAAAAEMSTTAPAEAKKLAAALASGNGESIRAALPAPRTKLNRPFDLVNL